MIIINTDRTNFFRLILFAIRYVTLIASTTGWEISIFTCLAVLSWRLLTKSILYAVFNRSYHTLIIEKNKSILALNAFINIKVNIFQLNLVAIIKSICIQTSPFYSWDVIIFTNLTERSALLYWIVNTVFNEVTTF